MPEPGHPQTGATPPASVDVLRGLWNCHGCGEGGSAIDAVRLAKGLTVAESFAWLRTRSGLHPLEPSRPLPASRPQPVVELAPPADADEILGTFCRQRGWRLDVAEHCGVNIVT